MEEKKKNKFTILWTILRIIIGIGLIAFLLIKLDAEKIILNIKNMDLRNLALALIPYFLFIVVSAWRWQVLLDYKKMDIPFKDSLIIYFIALFFNNFLPTTVGGDVMRIVYSIKKRKTDAFAIVIADRILGFIGLFIFGLFALLLITFILFSEKIYSFIHPFTARLKFFRVGERINNLHKTMTGFGSAWGIIIICIIQSIIIQALLAISPYLVLNSMGNYHISILPFFIYLPIINVISMIPISFNALGVRENAYVFLFQRAGLSGEVSLTVSLVSFFLTFLWSLVGGIFFIFYKKPSNV